jgi:hypothetical protein
MGGIATRTLRVFKDFCGDTALKNVIIVTNMWDKVTSEEGETRERQLRGDDRYFKPLLKANATMHRHDNTLESARRIVRQISSRHPLPLDIQTETVVQNKPLHRTSAGTSLRSQLLELAERLEVATNSVLEALKTTSDEKDTKLRLERELEEYIPRLARLRNEIKNMDVSAEEEIDVLQEWHRIDVGMKITTLLRRCYGKEDIRVMSTFWSAMGDTTKIVGEIYILFQEYPLSFSVKEQLLDTTSVLNKASQEKFDSWLSTHTTAVREMETIMERAITSRAKSPTVTLPSAIDFAAKPESTTIIRSMSETPPAYAPRYVPHVIAVQLR